MSQKTTNKTTVIRARLRFWLWGGLLSWSALQLAGCAAVPVTPPTEPAPAPTSASPAPVYRQVVELARGMLGTPYRYGGSDPRGFDCSGLVHYAYGQAGIALPRTTRGLYGIARPVPREQLAPGDLVFFQLKNPGVSHVGIFIGNNEFIHAPSTGKRVGVARLDDPYWQRRLLRAGRVPIRQSGGAGPVVQDAARQRGR